MSERVESPIIICDYCGVDYIFVDDHHCVEKLIAFIEVDAKRIALLREQLAHKDRQVKYLAAELARVTYDDAEHWIKDAEEDA